MRLPLPLWSALVLLLGGCATTQPANTANAYVRDVEIEGATLPLFRNVVSDQSVTPPLMPPDLRGGGSRQVRLHAVVGADGTVQSTHVRFANVTKATLDAAQDAVGRWRFAVIAADGRAIRYVAEVRLTYLVTVSNEVLGPPSSPGSHRSTTTWSVEIR